jgi:hypothetical protein
VISTQNFLINRKQLDLNRNRISRHNHHIGVQNT